MKIINLLSTLLILCTIIISCNFYSDNFHSTVSKSESIKIDNNELISIEIERNYFLNDANLSNLIVDSIKVRNISYHDLANLDIIINFFSKTDFTYENLLMSYRLNSNGKDTVSLKANEQKVFFLDDKASIKMDKSFVNMHVLVTGNNFDFNGSGTYGSYYKYYTIDTLNKNIQDYDTTYFENGTASGIVDYQGNLEIKPHNSTIYNLIMGNINLENHFLGRIQNNLDTIGKLESKTVDFPYSLIDSTINIFSLENKLPNNQNINEFQFVFFKK